MSSPSSNPSPSPTGDPPTFTSRNQERQHKFDSNRILELGELETIKSEAAKRTDGLSEVKEPRITHEFIPGLINVSAVIPLLGLDCQMIITREQAESLLDCLDLKPANKLAEFNNNENEAKAAMEYLHLPEIQKAIKNHIKIYGSTIF
ncbi:hypothetical protein DFA_04269 [Cavenderia fasciculata]|uniref:Uncharacterized protein n=1 Tax=Cavenderia fasciculata TaxID=261658 RepID=F4PP38_CACFS|nr:uncharacterized protein DFA_04269 [Cavenderia fasciculata]EGG22151.1 hypothetical protein DFA_04269 [Cavenderia fasciculata]|eukprot:XP_004360002.1 hypothetical protein DFA_04269 [Cavenderia fasciculata]